MTGRAAQQADRELAMFCAGLCKAHGWLGYHGKSYMTGQQDAAEYMMYITCMLYNRRNGAANF